MYGQSCMVKVDNHRKAPDMSYGKNVSQTATIKGYNSKQCLSFIITFCTACKLLMKILSISLIKVST